MGNPNHLNHPFEPNREELPPGKNYNFVFDRRKFLELTGGGLIVAVVLRDIISTADKTTTGLPQDLPATEVDSWIHVDKDGTVTVYTGKVEVGQNIRTSLSQIVAEELTVLLSSIKMVMGDTDLVQYDAGTFGSRTTPQMGVQLRKAAAAAKQALVELAAKKWNTQPNNLRTENGMVVNKTTNQKMSYGDIAKGEKLVMTISDTLPMTSPKDWKVSGKSVPKVDQVNFITGKHMFVSAICLLLVIHPARWFKVSLQEHR